MLCLSLILATTSRAEGVAVLSGTAITPKGPVELPRGCFLPEADCVRTGAKLAQLKAENLALKQQALEPSTVVIVSVVVGAVLGGATVALLKR